MNVKLLVALAGPLMVLTSVNAATFTVINTNSTGAGSLQQAIFDANTNAGTDTITFAITNLGNTIRPSAALPSITEPVTIDGRTQAGFISVPIVEISGGSAGAAVDGLKINTSNCVVSALVINGFLGDQIEITNGVNNKVEGCYLGLNLAGTVDASTGLNGILITNAANNIIGGLGATNRNFISGNNQSGIAIGGATSVSNSIFGNIIGLNITNNAVANSADGIRVNAPFTSIGGNTSAARNIISGNTGDGIEAVAPLGTTMVIRGNWIGVDTNGVLDRGNSANGILASAGAAIIGGSGAGEGNLIAGNNGDGIQLTSVSSTNHLVLGNVIGSASAFVAGVINSGNGILITTSSRSNVIGGILAGEANTIYFNGGDGIGVAAANANTNNAFRGNLIFGNTDSGIDLGAAGITANDNGDADVGANQLQNFPVLTSVSNTATEVFIRGTLNSRPSTTYAIDFFSSMEADAVLNGEGQFFIGSTNLATAADSNLTFSISFPIVLQGRHVSATATDPAGNTSEFSAAAASVSFAMAQTFTVVNTNDSGAGSLREAINQANLAATTGGDTIVFAITNLSTTISPSSELPTITDPVTIDGYTQPGAAANTSATIFNGTVLVRLAGASAGSGANGLTITVGNSTVRGLMITGFTGAGDGIEISGGGNNIVEGCLIGIDAAGTDQGNAANGVFISGSPNNIIGGTTPSARNVISGNNSDGVEISGGAATGNQVLGNIIGANQSGTVDVGNSADGIFVTGAGAAIIGGTNSGAGNLISGNNSDGIELNGLATTNCIVLGNRIGTEVTGVATLANSVHGVLITTSSRSNIIGGVLSGQANTIAFNGQDGINVAAATANTNNTFRGNSIFSNGTTTGELGIDLGADGILANDSGDPDTGANQLQNFPVLTSVTNSATETTFSGSLNSRPSTTYTIDLYANTTTDTAGSGEGQYYLGSTNLTTGADSNVTFTISLPVSPLPARFISATATDPFGNTSEFGTNVFAQSTAPGQTFTVINTNDSGAGSLRQAIADANASVTAGDTIVFAITNVSRTISPSSALPTITDRVVIDGSTQPGFAGVPIVELNGTSAGSGADGLKITTSNCVVRALVINRFLSDGIELNGGRNNTVEGCYIGLNLTGLTDQGNTAAGVFIFGSISNLIGGLDATNKNYISGNNGGVNITSGDSPGNRILGNVIGLNVTNGIVSNGSLGITTSSAFTQIGGSASGARNIISGNGDGMNILHPATNSVVQGNYIGTDSTGTIDRGNTDDGIVVTAGAVIIGGGGAGEGNLISGNNAEGIELNGVNSTNGTVRGNIIGADVSGTVALPNSSHGILITTSSRSNIIGGVLAGEANLIAFNGADGINVAAATANTNNTIRGNSIFSNGTTTAHLGIDLGADGILANDAGDADAGANQLQNFPVLTGVTNSLAGTDVAGSLNSAASTTFVLDFYSNPTSDTSGSGEGKTFLGSANVSTDVSGNTNFLVTIAATNLSGRYITATATDPFGNTSEFSTNIFATSTVPGLNLVVTNTSNSGPGSLRDAITQANAAINAGDTITFNIAGAGVKIISPTSALPTIVDPVTINGYSQPGASANTLTNGHNAVLLIRLDGVGAGASTDGLRINTMNSLVSGLSIGGFTSDGIEITGGSNNRIEGCYLGLDPDGATRRGNTGNGVNVISSSTGNTVGGETPAARCIVSANGRGVVFTSVAANNVKGSCIGTDATGTLDRGNTNSGVLITGSTARFNVIGGTNAESRNVISGNGENFAFENHGIMILAGVSNSILGNYIGLRMDGSDDLGNSGAGVYLGNGALTNFIGGSEVGAGNVISGNGNGGIDFSSDSPDQVGNVVRGNLIGPDASGMVNVGNNGHGISFSFADFNQIGGINPGDRNVISANGGAGVNINCCAAASNRFEGNFVGVDITGTNAMGNGGNGFYVGSPGNIIGGTAAGAGNIIANNGDSGVIHFISSHFGVAILGNNIYSNSGVGIDLGLDNGPTPNDTGDTDEGANHLQNFPVLSRVITDTNVTTMFGSLNSRSNTTYRIEFFDNASADASGFGEGQIYLGFTNVTTDAAGDASFVWTIVSNISSFRYITATATDPTNNTSEFSQAATVVPFDSIDLAVTIVESADPAARYTNFFYSVTITNNGPTNATEVFLTNTVPAGSTFVAATSSQGLVTHSAGVLTWNLGAISDGAGAIMTVEVSTTNIGSAAYTSAVSAAQTDHNPANNTANESTFFGVTDIIADIIDSPDPATAGVPMTLTVIVTNAGPDAATGTTLGFSVDGDFYVVGGVLSQGTYTLSFNAFSCTLGTILPGGTATLTVTAIPLVTGSFNNHHAEALRNESDPNFANNIFVNESTTVTPGSGVLQFASVSATTTEGSGVVAVTVNRTGGAIGTITVDYASSNITAVAGSDFTPSNGTLTFTNGQSSQSISVPLIEDSSLECLEQFRLNLFNPSGGAIAVLVTNVTISIYDNDLTASGTVVASSTRTNSSAITGNSQTWEEQLSQDGSRIAFTSFASDIVPGDTNNDLDIFVRNISAGTNLLVSANTNGVSGNSYSQLPRMSADGRYVAFESHAHDLVAGDVNNSIDIFVRDTVTGVTRIVSMNAGGTAPGSLDSYDEEISADGRFIVFESIATDISTNDLNGLEYDVFLRDMSNSAPVLVSVNVSGTGSASAGSFNPQLSDNGRFVVFESDATNLITLDTNDFTDVFVRDMQIGSNYLVSVNLSGTGGGNGYSFGAEISSDGRYVIFSSDASDLVAGDNNSNTDIFIRDLVTQTTRLVSANSSGSGSGNNVSYFGSMSSDGRFVGFESYSTDIVSVQVSAGYFNAYLRDTVSNVTYLVSVNCDGNASGDSDSQFPNVSDDGRYVVFSSYAGNVTSGDFTSSQQQVFRRDMVLGQTILISQNVAVSGGGNGPSYFNYISTNGAVIAFSSDATDLVSTDTNLVTDVFYWTSAIVVPVAQPVLSIQPTNATQLLVSWPSSTPSGFILETTTNLTPVIVWTSVTNSVSVGGTNKFVILDVNAGEPERYYRLKQ